MGRGNMTATEKLRALLDERGVGYETADGWWTSWDTAGALDVDAAVYCEDLGSGLEIRWHTITPEQAIAATLGNPEIVRCRDCKYYDGEPDIESMGEQCWRDPDHTGRSTPTVADGYCWRGERREQ